MIELIAGGPDLDEVMHETWGHLDAAPDVRHPGTIVFAESTYGERFVLATNFGDRAGDGPWFYEHLHDWLSHQDIERGCWQFTGWYSHDGDRHEGVYEFVGEITPLYLTVTRPDTPARMRPAMTDPASLTMRTGPMPDAPDGYTYTPAPDEVAAIMRRRFDGGGPTAIDLNRPGYLLHDVGNFWDGATSVRDNGDGTYTYRNPHNGEEDRFDAAGYWTRDGQHKPWQD